MVWAASSSGRNPPANRSCRAASTPRNNPNSSVSTVATSTVASVCIECCQRPSPESPAVASAAMTADRQPPVSSPTTSTTATSSHQGVVTSSDSSGLSRPAVMPFLIASVASYQCSSAHCVASLTGAAKENRQSPGNSSE